MSVKQVDGGYMIDFTINHQRYREKIPAPHNKQAEKKVAQREAIYQMAIAMDDEQELRKYPSSKILNKAFHSTSKFTINDYAKKWFKQKQRNWSHTTLRGYNQKYYTYIEPNWGSLQLDEFKASMFDEWAAESTLSGKSINEARNVLNQIYKRAFYDGVINTNPVERIERYKQIPLEPKPFSSEEIRKILSNLSTPYQQYFQFAFYSGLRTGELLGLRWMDIELNKAVAHIRTNITSGKEKTPKTSGSIRTVELHEKAIQALESIRVSKFYDSYRVFIDPKTLKEYKYADGLRKYIWKPTLEKLGIEYRYPYQCRHTYASMMLSQGKNPMWVAKQMGHADWGMIRRIYGRWLSTDER